MTESDQWERADLRAAALFIVTKGGNPDVVATLHRLAEERAKADENDER